MKRYSSIILICLISLCLLGCQSPFAKWFKADKKVDEVKQEITKNEDVAVEKTKGFIYGADISLELDPSPSIFSQTAEKFTDRARLTLGEPKMEEAVVIKEIVSNLTSTNQELVIKGTEQLSEKDKEIIDLQQNITGLEEKLAVKESKLQAVSQENAKLATTWATIKKWFFGIIWVVGIGLVLSVVSKFLPPPYSSIIGIVAAPIGLFIKFIHGLVPAAKDFAGVVAKTTYDETNKALKQVVESIQEAKTKDKPVFDKLEPFLKEITDTDVRQTITKKLQELGYV